jgi:hypothetical protein
MKAGNYEQSCWSFPTVPLLQLTCSAKKKEEIEQRCAMQADPRVNEVR